MNTAYTRYSIIPASPISRGSHHPLICVGISMQEAGGGALARYMASFSKALRAMKGVRVCATSDLAGKSFASTLGKLTMGVLKPKPASP